jgi:hypothetical protein
MACAHETLARFERAIGLLSAAGFAAAVLLANRLLAHSAQQLRQVAGDTIRRLDLQLDLPREAAESALVLPSVVLWIALIGGAAMLIYSLWDMLPVWRIRRSGAWYSAAAEADDTSPSQAAAAVVTASDELAQQGRFGEAMHVLLLQSLTEMRRCLDEQFADSLTSREILRRVRLSQDGRSAFGEIIARVEWTHFGQHPAAFAEYLACRKSYSRLVQAMHGERGI